MPTQELGIFLPRQPIPAPGKENPCVLFGGAPASTATTTLFFSKPKITVSGFPSQVTSATVTDLLSHLNRWCDLRSPLTATSVLDTCALVDTAKKWKP